ncbi:HEAT repeat domain-containing protein [Terriglobus sp. ADX1]|uniref:HEAT repeat domain-containing protein n=1 Tax=Terriglobus sp. ADX1 TaxID=2794063 RepID=UPI002FE66FF9
MKLNLHTACLLIACCTSPLMHAAVIEAPTAVSAEDDYTRGTQALDQQRWQDAIASFDRVVETKGKKADAALYWKAYALNKLGRDELASNTCSQLHTSFANSTWNKDCAALTASGAASTTEAVGDRASRHSSAGSDADLKALALNSLLNRDPAQALPLVRNILTGNNTPELKQRALTMLAQNPSPEAQALVRDVATGKVAPEEQKHAIRMMGVFQGKRANDTLVEIYRTSSDRTIKRTVISSLFISGDATQMVELARNEKDLSLKHDIVSQLALMKDKAATDYMMELLK